MSLPLVSADDGLEAVAGTPAGPLRVAVQAHLGLTKPPIQLEGISIVASIAPPSVSLTVTLENLDLGDGSAQTMVLNPDQLASEAFQVILGLLKQELASLAGPVASHLLGLLGLAGDSVPQFPFLSLHRSCRDRGLVPILGSGIRSPHLDDPHRRADRRHWAKCQQPGPNGPWTITLIPFDAQSSLDLVISVSETNLQVGVAATVFPGGPSGPGKVQASVVIATIPLSGTGNATVLPSASVGFIAPGDSSAQLVSTGPLTVSSFRTGLEWTGSALQPSVLLTNVGFDGTTYDHIDLTNADSVRAAASNAVQTAISNALGASAGSNLMALAGLSNILPTHSVDLTALVANPARTIAAFHREVLLDGRSWSTMLGQIPGRLGLPTATTGTGTPADLWLVPIATSGLFTLNLAAWNAQTSGVKLTCAALVGGLAFYASDFSNAYS